MLFLKGHLETFRFWSCQKERKPLDQNPNYSLHFFFACLDIGDANQNSVMERLFILDH